MTLRTGTVGGQCHDQAMTDTTTPAATTGLTDTELAILDLERRWWKYPGAKETTILEQLGMTATRYYQVLNTLLDRPEALAADPMVVRRLTRLRDARRAIRSPRRLAT